MLALQSAAGNAAVTASVQRKPPPRMRRERAASQDIKDVIKIKDRPGGKKKSQKPAPPAKDFFPKKPNDRFKHLQNMDDKSELMSGVTDALNSGTKNNLSDAEEKMLEYYFWYKRRDTALVLHRIYKKLGEKEKADFWMGVHSGEIKAP